MPNVTPNYGLKKPLPEEFYDIGVHNENMDVIDAKLKSIEGASEGIEYLKNINPTTTGYNTLLEYMASRYDDHPVIFGSVGGFSDLPAFSDGDTTAQGCINLCGGILTVTLWLRTETWCRGTNSLVSWTDTWRKIFDTKGGTINGALYINKDGERKGWIEPVTGEHELNIIATNDSKGIIRYLNINAEEDVEPNAIINVIDGQKIYKLYGEHNSPVKVFETTITTNWTADGDFFYQDIVVEGILDTDRAHVDILTGSDNSTCVACCEEFCKVFRVKTSNDSIRVWVTEPTEMEVPIQLEVVR